MKNYQSPQMDVVDLYEEYDLMESVSSTENPDDDEFLGTQKRRSLWDNYSDKNSQYLWKKLTNEGK